MRLTLNLKGGGANLKGSRILLIRGLCLVFIIALYRAAFCSVLASVFIVFSQNSVFQIYCSDFRYESNGIFVLGVGFFSSDKFRLFN